MRSDPSDDLDRLLEEATISGDPPGECPDENDLAAFAEERASDAERPPILAHLLGCASCRDVVRALYATSPPAAARPPLLRPWGRWAIAAAAAIVVAVGVAILVAGRDERESEDSAVLLAAAAARLAEEAPEHFGGFRPFAASELSSLASDPLRGEGARASPSGSTLETRPAFGWKAIPGARNYTVTVLGSEGIRWSRTTASTALAWPEEEEPLEPGARVVWTLSADDPHATEVERALHVVDDRDARTWAAVVAAAESERPPLRWLVLAHAALRRDLRAEAATYARRYRDAVPTDPLGEATLTIARDRVSSR